jgi:hypothetical protein
MYQDILNEDLGSLHSQQSVNAYKSTSKGFVPATETKQ